MAKTIAYDPITKKPTGYFFSYDSLEAMIAFSERMPTIKRNHPMAYKRVSLGDRDNMDFYGNTLTYDDAVELARKGWPQGREKMIKAYAQAKPQSVTMPDTYYDVAGAYPCVPLACAGDPLNMVAFSEAHEKKPSPVIRLGVNVWVSGAYSQSEIINFGAAILSYVDALEASAYRVELNALVYCRFTDGVIYSQEIPIKRAEQHMELDRVAFVLCNAAFFRRIAYAAREKEPKLDRADVLGYPQAMPARTDMLTIGGINTLAKPGSKTLKTPKAAAMALAPMLDKQLTELGMPSPEIVWGHNL